MPVSSNLTKIGAKIKIDPEKLRDRLPENLREKINSDPRGIVIDYKMTDGGGVGVIVKFSDGSTSWFFEEEFARG